MRLLYRYYYCGLTLTEWRSREEEVHLQALSSSEPQPRTQTQSVVKQSCLGRSLSLLGTFLRWRRDLFLLLLFTGVFRGFTRPCEFPSRVPRSSVENSQVNNTNPPTHSERIFYTFSRHLRDRYIFASYPPENYRKLVGMSSAPCSSYCTQFK